MLSNDKNKLRKLKEVYGISADDPDGNKRVFMMAIHISSLAIGHPDTQGTPKFIVVPPSGSTPPVSSAPVSPELGIL